MTDINIFYYIDFGGSAIVCLYSQQSHLFLDMCIILIVIFL